MNVTLSLNDDLVKKVRKIAVDRDTTLTGLIRQHLEEVAAQIQLRDESAGSARPLEETFQKFQIKVGKRAWTREDLHDRS